jgi:hypothetical protein
MRIGFTLIVLFLSFCVFSIMFECSMKNSHYLLFEKKTDF